MDTRVSRVLRRSITSCALACGLGLILGLMIWPAPPAAAQQWTAAQRAACEGDAMRLCGQYVPNVDQIVSCMSRNRRNLSPACRAVFDGGARRRTRT